mgnify:CR=1 FL=1
MPDPAAPAGLRLSVIIPHFNQPDLLAKCLDALGPQTGGPEGGGWSLAEILVCDNGSGADKRPEPVCDGRALVRVIDAAATPGPGHARNRGVEAAAAPLLVFTDADTVPAPDWLARVAACFGVDPAPDVLGGDIRILRADPARPTAIEAYEAVFSFRARDYVERDRYAATANMAATKAAFARVGPFGGIDIAEDHDWGRRASAAGLALRYDPGPMVAHPARPDFAELARKWDRLTGHAWAAARAGGAKGRAKWLAKAVAMPLSALAGIPRILRSDRIAGPRARWDAFAVLWRLRAYRGGLMLRLATGAGQGLSQGAWRNQ